MYDDIGWVGGPVTGPREPRRILLLLLLLLTPSAIYSTPAVTPSKAVDSLQKSAFCSQNVEHSQNLDQRGGGPRKVADRRTGFESVVTET